jgi:hypothetical protein
MLSEDGGVGTCSSGRIGSSARLRRVRSSRGPRAAVFRRVAGPADRGLAAAGLPFFAGRLAALAVVFFAAGRLLPPAGRFFVTPALFRPAAAAVFFAATRGFAFTTGFLPVCRFFAALFLTDRPLPPAFARAGLGEAGFRVDFAVVERLAAFRLAMICPFGILTV